MQDLDQFLRNVKLHQNPKFVIYDRVSTERQSDASWPRIRSIQRTLSDYGVQEVCWFWEERHAREVTPFLIDTVIGFAKDFCAGIIVPSIDRFLRPDAFHWNDQDVPYSQKDLQRIERILAGTPLFVYATLENARSLRVKVGQQATIKPIGRKRKNQKPKNPKPKREPGFLKKRRIELMPKVIRLRDQCKSYREIAELLGVPWSTVRNWIKKGANHDAKRPKIEGVPFFKHGDMRNRNSPMK